MTLCVCICVWASGCLHPLKVEVLVFVGCPVWVLATKLGFPARAASAFNC